MSDVLFYILVVVGFINILHFAFYLIGANIYDIAQFRRRDADKKRDLQDTEPLRPLISILIPAHNEETGILRTLHSVRNNTYKNVQVIVIDDASSDRTKKLVREFVLEYPEFPLQLMWQYTNKGKAEALNHALRNRVQGEFVMMIDADSVIGPDAIANALRYFEDPTVSGVAANVKIHFTPKPLALLQFFEHMIGYRSKKFYTVTNTEFIVGGVASTYRRSVLDELGWYDTDTQTEDIGLSLKIATLGNKQHRLVYAVDVLAMTESVQTTKALFRQRYRWKLGMLQNLLKYRSITGNTNAKYSKLMTFYRIPMAFLGEIILMLEPVLFGYVLYLSITYGELGFFIGAYLTILLYLVFVVWHDEHLSWHKRLLLSLYLPPMYFVFYIMNVIQLVAIIRCLLQPKKVLLKQAVSSTWVSPERHRSLVIET